MPPLRSCHAITTLTYFIILQTFFYFTIALPKDPASLFDLNGSVDRTAGIHADEPNLITSIDDPEWNLFSSQSSVNQDVVGTFDGSSPFIQNGDDINAPTDSSSIFQYQDPGPDPDLFPISLDSNSNSKPPTSQNSANSQDSTINPILLSNSLHDTNDNNGDKPSSQILATNLRFDLWNFWPWSCPYKLNSQAACCNGPEDDRGVRHGCGITAFNPVCDDFSHRFCCYYQDTSITERTWCVAPPPDGQDGSGDTA